MVLRYFSGKLAVTKRSNRRSCRHRLHRRLMNAESLESRAMLTTIGFDLFDDRSAYNESVSGAIMRTEAWGGGNSVKYWTQQYSYSSASITYTFSFPLGVVSASLVAPIDTPHPGTGYGYLDVRSGNNQWTTVDSSASQYNGKTSAGYDPVDISSYVTGGTSISVRARLTNSGPTGGQFLRSASWDTTPAFRLTVTEQNVAPTDVMLSGNSIAENSHIDALVGTLSTTDLNADDSFTYTLVPGTGSDDNSLFFISGNELKADASFDFETRNSYSIRVSSTDQGGLSTEESFTIVVTDANDPPTDITLSGATVREDAPIGAVIGRYATADADADDVFAYTLVAGPGDADNAAFALVNGELLTNAAFDYEAQKSFSIRVRSTDAGGEFVEKAFAIELEAVHGRLQTLTHLFDLRSGSDRAPYQVTNAKIYRESFSPYVYYWAPSVNNQWAEVTYKFDLPFALTSVDSPLGLHVANANSDVNFDNGAQGFLDVSADGENWFTVYSSTSSGGVVRPNDPSTVLKGASTVYLRARLFATRSYPVNNVAYSQFLRSRPELGLFDNAFVVSGVSGTNAPPTGISLSSGFIPENAAPNATVGELTTSDPNAGDTFTYTFAAGEGDADNGVFEIVENELRATGVLDFESKNAYTVRIRSTDSNGLFTEQSFIITVEDVNDAPTDIKLSSFRELARFSDSGLGVVVPNSYQDDTVLDGNRVFSQVPSGNGLVRVWSVDDSLSLTRERDIASPDNTTGRQSFGSAILPDGQFLAVGSFTTAKQASHDGQGYTYDLNTGTRISQFNPSPHVAQYFGTSGAISGDGLFVISENGNSQYSTDAAITFYSYDGSSLNSRQIGRSVFTSSYSDLGSEIAIHRDTVAVAYRLYATAETYIELWDIQRDSAGLPTGVQSRTRYRVAPDEYEAKSVATDNGSALNDNVFAVAQYSADRGMVQLFSIGDGQALQHAKTILPPDTAGATDFGRAIHISGNLLYVSAPNADVGQAGSGCVFVYDITDPFNPVLQSSFTAANLLSGEKLGLRFSASGDRLLVAAGPDSVYLFGGQSRQLTAVEGAASNAYVGSLSTIDPDLGNSHTYSFTSGEGAADNASFTIVGDELRTNTVFDYEAQSSYTVRIRSTDAGGLFTEKAFVISVIDVNEPPTAVSLSPAARSLADDTPTSERVKLADIAVTDDRLGTNMLSLSGPDATDFEIVGTALYLRAGVELDGLTKPDYSVIVNASDATLLGAPQTVAF